MNLNVYWRRETMRKNFWLEEELTRTVARIVEDLEVHILIPTSNQRQFQ